MNGNSANAIIAAITGEGWMAEDTGCRQRPTRDEVARLAYNRYEANGRKDSTDAEKSATEERWARDGWKRLAMA